MSSSAILVANDADQFALLVRPATEHTIIGRGVFAAKAIRIDFHRLGMQRIEVSHSSIGHGQQSAERAGILFSTSGVTWKGAELAATDIGLVGHDQPYWYTMVGPAQWGACRCPWKIWRASVSR